MVYESFCLKNIIKFKKKTHTRVVASFISMIFKSSIYLHIFVENRLPQIWCLNNKYPLSHFLHVKNLSGYILESLTNLQSRCWGSCIIWRLVGWRIHPQALKSFIVRCRFLLRSSMVPALQRRERGRQREVGGRKTKNALKETAVSFYNLVRSDIPSLCHFIFMPPQTPTMIQCGRTLWMREREWVMEAILRLATVIPN